MAEVRRRLLKLLTPIPLLRWRRSVPKFKRNGQGEVVEVSLEVTKITDAGLVHLTGLTELQEFNLRDAGVADLQKALPNCEISK